MANRKAKKNIEIQKMIPTQITRYNDVNERTRNLMKIKI